MRERIAAGYEPGALPWALGDAGKVPGAPDLRREFHKAEAALDAASTDAELRAAVNAYEAIWRAISTRYRARRQQNRKAA